MATHDYVIDNSTGANVRADINNVLQAILTNNSSSSAPSTTAAYMWWADTTNGVLKIRNSANNDWVELLQLDGTLTLEDGSASTPGLAFRDDLNTGIFSSAADTFNIATGGVERMRLGSITTFNQTSADVDFRIKGDTDADLFYLDASADRIGISTQTPSAVVSIKGNGGLLSLIKDSDSNNNGIIFQDSSSNNHAAVWHYGSDDALVFWSGGSTERMRLDSSGRLLLGTTSSRTVQGDSTLQIEADSTSLLSIVRTSNNNGAAFLTIGKTRNGSILQDDDVIGILNFHGDDGSDLATPAAQIRVAVDGTPGSNDMPGRIEFLTTLDGNSASSERMRITNAGNVGIGTTSPDLPLHVSGTSNADEKKLFRITNAGGSAGTTAVMEFECGVDEIATISANNAGGDIGNLMFATATSQGAYPSEKMRIGSGGNILFGVTGETTTHASFRPNSQDRMIFHLGSSTTGASNLAIFSNPNGTVGSISTSGSATSFNTSSDYRLKENVVAISDGITRLKTLKPSRFNFIADAETTVDGFLAHEVTAVPEAITGTKDEVVTQAMIDAGDYKEGTLNDPIYQGIDQSKLVPLLTAALQEAVAKIEVLETKVAALEAA